MLVVCVGLLSFLTILPQLSLWDLTDGELHNFYLKRCFYSTQRFYIRCKFSTQLCTKWKILFELVWSSTIECYQIFPQFTLSLVINSVPINGLSYTKTTFLHRHTCRVCACNNKPRVAFFSISKKRGNSKFPRI